MPQLRQVTKFRPRAFMPFVILSLWVSVAFAGVLGFVCALIAAPLAYIITVAVLKGRRLRKFQQEFAPAMIQAARVAEPAGVSRSQ